MSNDASSRQVDPDANPDPLTGEAGSHPVATGVGSAGAGVAGAVIGTAVAGPLGTVVGGVLGAVVGGLSGKAIGEAIDPTVEEAFWRDEHARQPYAQDGDYQTYRPAYQAGYEHAQVTGAEVGSFAEAEPELKQKYESGGHALPWIKARVATESAWTRVRSRLAQSLPDRPSEGGSVSKDRHPEKDKVNTRTSGGVY